MSSNGDVISQPLNPKPTAGQLSSVCVLVDCFTTEAYWSFCPVNPTCRPPRTVYIQSTRSNSTQYTRYLISETFFPAVGVVMKKLNPTYQKQTTQEQSSLEVKPDKHTKCYKPKQTHSKFVMTDRQTPV